MDPRTLFGEGLTVPRHENNDLHYIGEALPVPSLAASSVDEATPSYVGGSPIPAREDHIHSFGGITLTNYYTKEEIDIMLDDIVAGAFDLSNYYTKDEIDAMLNALATAIDNIDARTTLLESEVINIITVLEDHEDRITVVEIGGGGVTVQWFEMPFSYGTIVAPPATTTLGRYDAFKAFKITEFCVTLVLTSTSSYTVKIWHQVGASGAFSVVDTVTIAAGDYIQNHVFTSPYAVAGADVIEVTIDTNSTGTGEVLTAVVRGFYD